MVLIWNLPSKISKNWIKTYFCNINDNFYYLYHLFFFHQDTKTTNLKIYFSMPIYKNYFEQNIKKTKFRYHNGIYKK